MTAAVGRISSWNHQNALQFAVVLPPFGQEIFGTTATHRRSPAVGAGLALAILALMETDQALRGRSTPTADRLAAPGTRTARRGRATRHARRRATPNAGDVANHRQQTSA